jgi:lysyl-tRNA synthetase class I
LLRDFLDKEGKKISKSRGNGISIEEWLTYAPTESLALYIFQSPKKAKRLYFDVIPKSTDEYLEFVKRYNENNGENTNSKFHTEPSYDEKFLREVQVSTAEYSNVFEERKQALTTKLP